MPAGNASTLPTGITPRIVSAEETLRALNFPESL